MLKQVMVGSGAAAVLSIGMLLGGLTTGLVGAQTPPATTPPAQAQPSNAPETPDTNAEAPDAGGAADVVETAPAGSITSAQAQQDAATYIAQTAPYSSQGLKAGTVTVNDENGTIIYAVDFSNGAQSSVEVKVSTEGKVLGAESGTDTEAAGAEAAGTSAAPDSPTGHADAAGAAGSASGAQN